MQLHGSRMFKHEASKSCRSTNDPPHFLKNQEAITHTYTSLKQVGRQNGTNTIPSGHLFHELTSSFESQPPPSNYLRRQKCHIYRSRMATIP